MCLSTWQMRSLQRTRRFLVAQIIKPLFSRYISRCLSPLVYLYLFPFQAVCFYFLFFVP